jgi:hypothetical protein
VSRLTVKSGRFLTLNKLWSQSHRTTEMKRTYQTRMIATLLLAPATARCAEAGCGGID